ncbi:MAG: hypothetical protein WD988_02185 [Candidatus Curtissbacteria bacterium]
MTKETERAFKYKTRKYLVFAVFFTFISVPVLIGMAIVFGKSNFGWLAPLPIILAVSVRRVFKYAFD